MYFKLFRFINNLNGYYTPETNVTRLNHAGNTCVIQM